MRNLLSLKALITLFTFTFSALTFAGPDTETDANGVILAGHDPVAYFTVGRPVEGHPDITAVYNDAIYRFSSEQNRDAFSANPAKYAPAYGGFCAYGMTFGKKFEVDGKAFEIVDGKLYVNKNKDVYAAWKEDVKKHLDEANAEWPKIEFVPAIDL